MVLVPAVWLMLASLYGPQLPLAADVTQGAPEPDEPVPPDEPLLGEPEPELAELDPEPDPDGEADVALAADGPEVDLVADGDAEPDLAGEAVAVVAELATDGERPAGVVLAGAALAVVPGADPAAFPVEVTGPHAASPTDASTAAEHSSRRR